MSKPKRDLSDTNTGLQEVHGNRMPHGVRSNMAFQKRRTGLCCCHQCQREPFSHICARHWPTMATWQQGLLRLQALKQAGWGWEDLISPPEPIAALEQLAKVTLIVSVRLV